MSKVKVAVIGGGPGGYVAAIRAAQLGGQVTLIEKNKLGGTCLNVGCIPTKALLHASEFLSCTREAAEYGIQMDVKDVDWNGVQKKKASVVAQLVGGVTGLMKANKIKVINGTASFAGHKKLDIRQGDKVSQEEFDSIIIAAGSVPSVPPIPGLKDNPLCIDSTGALSLEKIPKKNGSHRRRCDRCRTGKCLSYIWYGDPDRGGSSCNSSQHGRRTGRYAS